MTRAGMLLPRRYKMIQGQLAYRALVDWVLFQAMARPHHLSTCENVSKSTQAWIVERAFGWLNRPHRLAKAYERTPKSDRAFVTVAMIHLLVKRLT